MRACILVFLLLISTTLLAQAPATAAQKADPAGIDAIIELVKAKTSEAMVIKSIQREGKPYDLGPSDMLKLKKAGVSDKIIDVMMDPASATTTTVAVEPAPGAKSAKASEPAKPEKEKKSGGIFGSIKDTLKGDAKKTVEGAENTANSTVDKTVQGGQKKADAAVDDTVGTATDKANTTTSKATDKANTNTSRATSSTTTKASK